MARTREQQRHWNDGYSAGYKAAHTILQREIRAEYAARSSRVRFAAWLRRRVGRA